MARLTFKKWFEHFKPDEETTTILLNGYTEIVEPTFEPGSMASLQAVTYHYLVGSAVDKLAEYEDLEEQGLLLKLPFEVGSHVYILTKCLNITHNHTFYKIELAKVVRYTYNSLKNFTIVCLRGSEAATYEQHFFKYDIGKTLFEKIEEAEAALQKMQEGE